jgi:hypothetical protein
MEQGAKEKRPGGRLNPFNKKANKLYRCVEQQKE